jgi:hypothetical protein
VVMVNGMLTGKVKITGCFDGKMERSRRFIWVWTLTWRKYFTKSVFWRQFSVLILEQSSANDWILIEVWVTYHTDKFARLVFSFVNFVVSCRQKFPYGTAFWRKKFMVRWYFYTSLLI